MPRQATALFNTRNWNTTDGIWKTFYDLQITASVWFKFGWGTPMEVEGWTLEGVEFRQQDQPKPMPLDKVPPRLFSEVMRDLDLVVSVAHRGGVDPEASASTVEMRAALLRETCALLGIESLRDATLGMVEDLPEPLDRRARHVVESNARVEAAVAALTRGDLSSLGTLLDQEHASLRDDYEISTPEVERAVARLKDAGALGARIIGGGFGGHVLECHPHRQVAEWIVG